MKWACSTCDREIIPVEGVTATWQRGYWWCAHCVNLIGYENGEPIVAFPSRGKLIPSTIMTEDVESE